MEKKRWTENPGKIPVTGPFHQSLQTFLKDLEKHKKYVVHESHEFVTIHDGCPKSSLHLLVLPKEPIESLEAIQQRHVNLLKRMAEYIRWIMLEKLAFFFPGCEMTHGIHAIPTCSQLHVHVMSQDLSTEHVKSAKRFNSFQPPFFVSLDDIIRELESSSCDLRKRFKLATIEAENERQLVCHHEGCGTKAKTLADLQKHMCSCCAPLPKGRVPQQWLNDVSTTEAEDVPSSSVSQTVANLTNEAQMLCGSKAWQDAVRPLSEIVRLRPDLWKGHLLLAQALQKCGELPKAIDALQSGLAHCNHEEKLIAELTRIAELQAQEELRLQDDLQMQQKVNHSHSKRHHKSAGARANAIPFVFDMETNDPDDVLTLLFLGSSPMVDLRAVTITPGSEEQVRLVRWLLDEMRLPHARIGAQDWPANAKVNAGMRGDFYESFGRSAKRDLKCEAADHVLQECCDEFVTLLTGAPLHNLGAALRKDNFKVGRWVAQGGFAGEGVVPKALQLSHLKGKVACNTTNFDGNIQAAEAALTSSKILNEKLLVSKNVCHGAVYDESWHKALGEAVAKTSLPGLHLMYRAMNSYIQNKRCKKLHDPLALAAALDKSVCEFVEVQVVHQKDGWESRLAQASGTWISINFDHEKFQAVLLPR